jgi:hypothetical protein
MKIQLKTNLNNQPFKQDSSNKKEGQQKQEVVGQPTDGQAWTWSLDLEKYSRKQH